MNKHARAAEEGSLEWAEGFGLFRDARSYRIFEAVGVGRLAAMCRPFCGRGDLVLLSIFYAWMFLQDDFRDESEAGRSPDRLSVGDRRSLDVLEGDEPAHGDDPVVHAMRDLRERFAEVAPGPLWMRRFTRSIRNYFDATVWEASNRARSVVPDPEPYIRMRPLTGGLDIDEELIGLSDDSRPPRRVLDNPAVKRMTRASMNVVCWSNDVLSLEKELAHGDVHNLVIVLREATGLPLEEAVGRVVEMHNAEVRDFIALKPELPSFGEAVDANLSRYVSILESRMRGNLDWSLDTGRYAQAARQTPADELTAGQPPVG